MQKRVSSAKEDRQRKFRARLRETRELRGWTQATLAEKAGLPAVTISHFETGTRTPSAESLVKLADTLGVTADYLLGRHDSGEFEIEGDEEAGALFRHFKGMSAEAREQVKALFKTLARIDRKRGTGAGGKKK